MIRVLLNVSSPALRAGLRALLSSDEAIEIVNDPLDEESEADVVITPAGARHILWGESADAPMTTFYAAVSRTAR